MSDGDLLTRLLSRLAAAVPAEAAVVGVRAAGMAGLAGVAGGPSTALVELLERGAAGRRVVTLDGDSAGSGSAGAGPGPVAVGPGAVDCLVYLDLHAEPDPVGRLRRDRALLRSDGTVCAGFANAGHQGTITQLLRATSPYGGNRPVPEATFQLFTPASAIEALLDAGYLPDTVDRLEEPVDPDFAAMAGPLLELLGVTDTDAARALGTTHLVLRGTPLSPVDGEEEPMTFVACVNDEAQLEANLLSSPCLRPPSPHQLLVFRGAASAAEGLNAGIDQARHDLVVLLHQDVYLPEGWPARFQAQWRAAAARGGPIGVAGVFGVQDRTRPFDAIGCVVHRDRLLRHRELPADVDGLDELLMVVERTTPLRFTAELGWHLYGTDLSLQAEEAGFRVVVLEAPCLHNSLTGRVPWKYRESERVLASRWKARLPVHTNLSSIDHWMLREGAAEPGRAGPIQDSGCAPAAPVSSQEDQEGGRPQGGGRSGATPGDGAGGAQLTELVHRLRSEQAAIHTELEQARLHLASMRASPFWRARQLVMGTLERLGVRRHGARSNHR